MPTGRVFKYLIMVWVSVMLRVSKVLYCQDNVRWVRIRVSIRKSVVHGCLKMSLFCKVNLTLVHRLLLLMTPILNCQFYAGSMFLQCSVPSHSLHIHPHKCKYLFPTCSSSLLMTYPYHIDLLSCTFSHYIVFL